MTRLPLQLLLALILGTLLGVFFPALSLVLAPLGDIFIRLLKLFAIPLVFTSILSAIINLGHFDQIGRVGWKMMGVVLLSNSVAAGVAIFVGTFFSFSMSYVPPVMTLSKLPEVPQSMSQYLLSFIPENVLQAFISEQSLALIFLAFAFGFAILAKKSELPNLINLIENCDDLLLKLIHFVISFSPIGVFALIATMVASLGVDSLTPLLIYLLNFTLATGAFLLLFLSIYLLSRKGGRLRRLKQVSPALMTAFSTSSSLATLPVTLQSLTQLGVSKAVSGFLAPIGATLNKNGTTIFLVTSTLFLADLYHIQLSLWQFIVLFFSALLFSLGTAAVPSGGTVMLILLISLFQIPLSGIALILVVDRVTDMTRTTVNILGDCCAIDYVAADLKEHSS